MATKVVTKLLDDLGCKQAEIGILFTDNREIAKLNKKYRAKSGPTDVLSFALLENSNSLKIPGVFGDVVISVETARIQSYEYELTIREELLRLIIHGVLHLCGYDPVNVSKARKNEMENLEDRLFSKLRKYL